MKKLLKNNLKTIIVAIIASVVTSVTTIFAYSLIAENVGYTPRDTTWNVENVDAALNNLNLRTNQLSTHYSTEEQVVGEWIDGKPIYQITFVCTSTLNFNHSTWFSLNNAFSGITSSFVQSIDTLVNVTLKNTSGYVNSVWVLKNYPSTGTLGAFSYGSSGISKGDGTITLLYTKTTD